MFKQVKQREQKVGPRNLTEAEDLERGDPSKSPDTAVARLGAHSTASRGSSIQDFSVRNCPSNSTNAILTKKFYWEISSVKSFSFEPAPHWLYFCNKDY